MNQPADLPRATLADLLTGPNGFDTIRLAAACAVILSHAFPLTGVEEPLYALTGQASIGTLAVSAFFLISGFLVSASHARSSLQRFAIKRVRRIMPGLLVAVAVSAFLIGPVFTELPLKAYFASTELWAFLGNAVFLPVGYDLPGTFADRPLPAVNGSLWSLKYEAACYILVPLVMALTRWRAGAVILAVMASFAITRAIPEGVGGPILVIDLAASLFRFFGMGMLFFLFAEKIPISRSLGAVGALATALAAFTPVFVEVAAVAGSYALLVFGAVAPEWFRNLTAKGDVSYGVYVYAFPIQQILVPLSIATGTWAWLANTVLALPLALMAGWISWRFVEKPFMTYRRPIAASVVTAG